MNWLANPRALAALAVAFTALTRGRLLTAVARAVAFIASARPEVLAAVLLAAVVFAITVLTAVAIRLLVRDWHRTYPRARAAWSTS